MMDQKLLTSNIFAFYLTTQAAEKQGLKSDLTFGYYDKEKFKGEIQWHDVDYKYMFGVKLDDIKVAGKSTKPCEGMRDCLVTFDSGTSLMSMPTDAVNSFVKSGIPTMDHAAPCNDQREFGDITYVIGGKDYTISNDEWTLSAEKKIGSLV